MKKIVMIPETLDRRKKTWRKHLERVDKEKTNGYAFVGNWLQAGERAELKIGSFILCYDEAGSMKNWYPVVRLFRVGRLRSGMRSLPSWPKHRGRNPRREACLNKGYLVFPTGN
jgi:hypothetical protein